MPNLKITNKLLAGQLMTLLQRNWKCIKVRFYLPNDTILRSNISLPRKESHSSASESASYCAPPRVHLPHEENIGHHVHAGPIPDVLVQAANSPHGKGT